MSDTEAGSPPSSGYGRLLQRSTFNSLPLRNQLYEDQVWGVKQTLPSSGPVPLRIMLLCSMHPLHRCVLVDMRCYRGLRYPALLCPLPDKTIERSLLNGEAAHQFWLIDVFEFAWIVAFGNPPPHFEHLDQQAEWIVCHFTKRDGQRLRPHEVLKPLASIGRSGGEFELRSADPVPSLPIFFEPRVYLNGSMDNSTAKKDVLNGLQLLVGRVGALSFGELMDAEEGDLGEEGAGSEQNEEEWEEDIILNNAKGKRKRAPVAGGAGRATTKRGRSMGKKDVIRLKRRLRNNLIEGEIPPICSLTRDNGALNETLVEAAHLFDHALQSTLFEQVLQHMQSWAPASQPPSTSDAAATTISSAQVNLDSGWQILDRRMSHAAASILESGAASLIDHQSNGIFLRRDMHRAYDQAELLLIKASAIWLTEHVPPAFEKVGYLSPELSLDPLPPTGSRQLQTPHSFHGEMRRANEARVPMALALTDQICFAPMATKAFGTLLYRWTPEGSVKKIWAWLREGIRVQLNEDQPKRLKGKGGRGISLTSDTVQRGRSSAQMGRSGREGTGEEGQRRGGRSASQQQSHLDAIDKAFAVLSSCASAPDALSRLPGLLAATREFLHRSSMAESGESMSDPIDPTVKDLAGADSASCSSGDSSSGTKSAWSGFGSAPSAPSIDSGVGGMGPGSAADAKRSGVVGGESKEHGTCYGTSGAHTSEPGGGSNGGDDEDGGGTMEETKVGDARAIAALWLMGKGGIPCGTSSDNGSKSDGGSDGGDDAEEDDDTEEDEEEEDDTREEAKVEASRAIASLWLVGFGHAVNELRAGQ